MSIPFDPKELQIVRRQPSFNPALPGTALFDFPITEREAYVSTVLNKQLVWQPYGGPPPTPRLPTCSASTGSMFP